MLPRIDLEELLTIERGPAVSIFLAMHLPGQDTRQQDPIRLRNLLNTAAKRLSAEHRSPEIAALLEPARKLIEDEGFWKSPERGLAVLLAPGFDRIHKLPIEVPEELFIGSHFYIKPLLPLVDPAGAFWLLAISAGRTRFYQGSRWTFAEVTGLDLPQGVSEIHDETEYQENHYASPVGRPPRAPSGLAKAQAFGDAPEELRKTELIELLRRIVAAVEPVIKRQPAPVILAAAPEIQGNFRERAQWKELLPKGILENPDALSPQELHAKACDAIKPNEEEARAWLLGHLMSLLGNGNNKATTKPDEIVKAAHYGRVDRLFLCIGQHLWGRFDPEQDRIVAHGSAVEGDDDLLDYAALMTLRQGGSVMLVDRTQLPPTGPAAAILRY
jgi:Bacterial archaeo-eukaryotic release factor family 3